MVFVFALMLIFFIHPATSYVKEVAKKRKRPTEGQGFPPHDGALARSLLCGLKTPPAADTVPEFVRDLDGLADYSEVSHPAVIHCLGGVPWRCDRGRHGNAAYPAGDL